MFAVYFFDLFRLFFDLFRFRVRFRSMWTGLKSVIYTKLKKLLTHGLRHLKTETCKVIARWSRMKNSSDLRVELVQLIFQTFDFPSFRFDYSENGRYKCSVLCSWSSWNIWWTSLLLYQMCSQETGIRGKTIKLPANRKTSKPPGKWQSCSLSLIMF